MSSCGDKVSLEELMAVMAHDLNNPITALVTNLSFLDSILSSQEDTDVGEALSDARMLCEVLRRLASNVDLLTQRGTIPNTTAACDLVVVAREIVGRMSTQASASEVQLALEVTGSGIFAGSRDLCARAIENMVAYGIERAVKGSSIVVRVASVDAAPTVAVSFVPRSKDPPPALSASVSPAQRKRSIQSTFGRGLSLYCAQVAAAQCVGRLVVDEGDEKRVTVRLVLPDRQER